MGQDENVKYPTKENFYGFLHFIWTMSVFSRAQQLFLPLPTLLAHEQRNINQNKTHKYQLVSSTAEKGTLSSFNIP